MLVKADTPFSKNEHQARTKQCTAHLEVVPGDPQRKTYLDGNPQGSLENTVFPWGSLTKMVVVLALSIIINELATSDQPKNERFKPLRNAWEKPFVECFNRVSEVKMPNLSDKPKVEELVTHFSGIPPVNHIIMAPDGTPLMSKDAFPAVASELVMSTYGKSELSRPRWCYSNGNTILIGMLIEAASGMLLPEAVDWLVFKRFGMRSAYMGTRPDDPNVALPHKVSAEGTVPISSPQTLSDPLCTAPMGVRSNIHDMAIFFRSITKTFLDKDGDSEMTYLLDRCTDMGLETGCSYFPCGIQTTLDTTSPGSQSLNRLVSPKSKSSNYILGFEQSEDKPVGVYYHAGVINGFECCTYIIPSCRAFLIVQANTTGRVDATDHISRLILQTLFELKPHNGPRVDIPAMAKLGAEERAELLADITRSQSVLDDDSAIPPSHLVGTYTHVKYHQTFLITEKEGKLWVRWQGSREVDGRPAQSGEMQLLRVNAQRVRMKVQFNVDRLGEWRDVDLMVWRDNNQVTSLRRKDPNSEEKFIVYVRSP